MTNEKHPRIRGESASLSLLLNMVTETSPHTRGKHDWRRQDEVGAGNIPAYAGKAYLSYGFLDVIRKHPRIRGESFTLKALLTTIKETSPHTRGKPSSPVSSEY